MRIFNVLLNLIFPNVCGFCDVIDKNNLCPNCEAKLQIHKKERKITVFNKYFDELMYLYNYEGIVRNTIIRFKFNEKAYIYRTFVNEMLKSEKICYQISSCDIMLPVPIHMEKRIERGYNQSELICKYLAKEMNKSYSSKTLLKYKRNLTQSELNKSQRVKNVLGVYKINPKYIESVKNKSVVLVDDIYTTGSTVNECSKVLKQAGAKRVTVLTIAKD